MNYMSLTKKDKEELKELIREVIGESRPKTIDSEGTMDYTDMFVNRSNDSIADDIVGDDEIQLAPEDFVLKKDFKLKDGTILKKGKRYFIYDEAMALEEELFEPQGYISISDMDEYNKDPENNEKLWGIGTYNSDGDELYMIQWNGKDKDLDQKVTFACYASAKDKDNIKIYQVWMGEQILDGILEELTMQKP